MFLNVVIPGLIRNPEMRNHEEREEHEEMINNHLSIIDSGGHREHRGNHQ